MSPPSPPSPSTAPAVCPNCAFPDTDRQDFCPSCGEYLRWDEQTGEARPAPAPPAYPPAPAAAPSPAKSPATTEEPPAPEPVLLVLDGGRPTITVAAGQRASLAGLIRNQSGLVDNYDLRVTGVPEAWTTPPPTLYLLPFGSGDGHEQRFDIALSPPRTPAAEARSWPLTVEAVSRSRGAVVARAEATLVVLPFHEVAMRPRPQRRRSRGSARFDVELASRGNAPVTVALTAADGAEATSPRLETPSVRLAPGGSATARLRVTPRRTIWWGRPEEHTIEIAAALAEGAASPPPQTVTLRQRPWIPWWLPVALLMVIALLIALLALRGERITVPEVRGETVEVAQQRLVDAGLEAAPRLQQVTVDDQSQIGRVLAQNPAAGGEIGSDDAVILQAGVANQAVAVPDVRGRTRDEAQRILEASGLTLGVIEPGDAPGDARVDFQNPAAGGQARLGGPVNVILVEPEQDAEDGAEEPEQPPAGEEDGPAPGEEVEQPDDAAAAPAA
jgi:hypothetical protein